MLKASELYNFSVKIFHNLEKINSLSITHYMLQKYFMFVIFVAKNFNNKNF